MLEYNLIEGVLPVSSMLQQLWTYAKIFMRNEKCYTLNVFRQDA